MTDLSHFLYHTHHYHGSFSPEKLVFDANLQEFSQRVTYICGLEMNGKLSPEEAYAKIRTLLQQLEQSKKQLGIGHSTPDDERKSDN